ncbi:MAG TPA: ADOP family duplicated permease [Thermoanaerobaculia bacterium]|nr:ADOP family duplicated permease [Thermoanaerobaculia bacterium]
MPLGRAPMNDLSRALRTTVRSLARSPGYTVVTLVTLALVLGANTAMFSVVDAVLLAGLPYPQADRLYDVRVLLPPGPDQVERRGLLDDRTFAAWREGSRALAGLGAYRRVPAILTGQGVPVRLPAAQVTPSLFHVLGVAPAFGRAFAEEGGAEPEVILGHDLWQRRFSGERSLLGRRLMLDGTAHRVSAVMPRGFFFPDPEIELWTRLRLAPPPEGGDGAVVIGEQYLPMVARLRPSASSDAAETEAESVRQGLYEQGALLGDPASAGRVDLAPLADSLVAQVRPALVALGAAVLLVLLIACGNLAGLLLARNAARDKELAIRLALGSGRGALVRRLVGESLLLALAGGAAGCVVALWLHRLLPRLIPPGVPRLDQVALDLRVFFFALLASLFTGIAIGLLPALRAGRARVLARLPTGATEGVDVVRSRNVLLVAQVALATVLLIAAALLVRSFLALVEVDPGFEPRQVLVTTLDLELGDGVAAGERRAFLDQLLARLESLPVVDAAGVAAHLPLAPELSLTSLGVPGRSPQQPTLAVRQWTSPGYLRALSLHLVEGRWLTPRDHRIAAPVALVNDVFARRYFAATPVIGQRIAIGAASVQIVGRLEDVRLLGPVADAKPEVFLSYRLQEAVGEGPPARLGLAIRTGGDRAAVDRLVRTTVAQLAPGLPVERLEPLGERWGTAVARPRFYALLLTGFAGLALVLAASGLYGTLAYSVARSARQLAVRRALGALPRNVLALVLRRGMGSAVAGIVLGMGMALLASQTVAHLLFGVTTRDLPTYAGAAAVLALAALLACYLPARRASRVDPAVALRHE